MFSVLYNILIQFSGDLTQFSCILHVVAAGGDAPVQAPAAPVAPMEEEQEEEEEEYSDGK